MGVRGRQRSVGGWRNSARNRNWIRRDVGWATSRSNGRVMPLHAERLTIAVLLTMVTFYACDRPPAEDAQSAANSEDAQKLPFDRQARSTGVSPSQTLIPYNTRLPEGVPIPVRLQSRLSSTTSQTGDSFAALIDEAIEIDGIVLIPTGTPVTGRILEAKAAGHSLEPGYLRIVLVSMNVGGRSISIETSSIFAKGGAHENRLAETGVHRAHPKDVTFENGRRLDFRLAQSVDLQ